MPWLSRFFRKHMCRQRQQMQMKIAQKASVKRVPDSDDMPLLDRCLMLWRQERGREGLVLGLLFEDDSHR